MLEKITNILDGLDSKERLNIVVELTHKYFNVEELDSETTINMALDNMVRLANLLYHQGKLDYIKELDQ